MRDGAVAADKENTESTVLFHGCPAATTTGAAAANHTKEYCEGYKAG